MTLQIKLSKYNKRRMHEFSKCKIEKISQPPNNRILKMFCQIELLCISTIFVACQGTQNFIKTHRSFFFVLRIGAWNSKISTNTHLLEVKKRRTTFECLSNTILSMTCSIEHKMGTTSLVRIACIQHVMSFMVFAFMELQDICIKFFIALWFISFFYFSILKVRQVLLYNQSTHIS